MWVVCASVHLSICVGMCVVCSHLQGIAVLKSEWFGKGDLEILL